MNRSNSPRQFDAREEGKGHGNAHTPGAPDPLPGGIEGDGSSGMPSRERDARKGDGLADIKKMEQNAEEGRE